jgi:hypothetical protein
MIYLVQFGLHAYFSHKVTALIPCLSRGHAAGRRRIQVFVTFSPLLGRDTVLCALIYKRQVQWTQIQITIRNEIYCWDWDLSVL